MSFSSERREFESRSNPIARLPDDIVYKFIFGNSDEFVEADRLINSWKDRDGRGMTESERKYLEDARCEIGFNSQDREYSRSVIGNITSKLKRRFQK